MRSAVILVILAVSASVLVAKGLNASTEYTKKFALPEIEPNSVADHCTKAIPQIWQHARESDEDLEGAKGKLAFVAFNYVATSYCVCNQTRFGENRSTGEKELFGKMAGLNLKMEFSHGFTKSLRKKLNKETQSLVKRHQSLIKRKPAWLKDINDDFRACKKEQKLTNKFSSYRSLTN